jgi:hypothetical protein
MRTSFSCLLLGDGRGQGEGFCLGGPHLTVLQGTSNLTAHCLHSKRVSVNAVQPLRVGHLGDSFVEASFVMKQVSGMNRWPSTR